jgi:hypothetical protein
MPPYCILLVVLDAPLLCFVGVCHRPHTMLVLVNAPLLCSIGACQTPLLRFVDVCHGSLVAFCWCLLGPPTLLHYVGAC